MNNTVLTDTMSNEEIWRTWVWTPRLMFNASLLYDKKLKDLTNDELFEVKKYSINQRNESNNG
jgi:hypothetical protein